MKTTVIISGIVALYILGTFAIAPIRHGADKMNFTPSENNSIVPAGSVTMLPGVVITAGKKKSGVIAVAHNQTGDLSYLYFDVNDYIENAGFNPDEGEVLPEASEMDFTYLKFRISNFYSDAEFDGRITEIPLPENKTDITPAKPVSEFDYLKFDVTKYYNAAGQCPDEKFELPEE